MIPKYKFFDIAKREFSKASDWLFINEFGKVICITCVRGRKVLCKCQNVIKISLSGFTDIEGIPGYDGDILQIKDNGKIIRGIIQMGEPVLEWRVWFENEDQERFLAEIQTSASMYQAKIIGSSLTNSELLNEKF